jgi:LytS/YehU family sensor histidine kinase
MPEQSPPDWQRIGLHLMFWSVYLPVNAIISVLLFTPDSPVDLVFGKTLLAETCSLPAKIGLVYFVFYWVVPRYVDRENLWRLSLLTFSAFLMDILLYRLSMVYVFTPLFNPAATPQLITGKVLVLTAFDTFITLAVALTIKFFRLNYEHKDLAQHLLREKLTAELRFLRAQTNPHFLFNTLNNLYALARKKSDHTPDAILKLSKILRFMLYDCRQHQVPLGLETKVVEDYIELEKLRYWDNLYVHFSCEVANREQPIAPLLLLPFVENAFKHGGAGPEGIFEIVIKLSEKAGNMNFSVENTKEAGKSPEKGGIGHANVRRQLELLYPGRYEFHTHEDALKYGVQLKILL